MCLPHKDRREDSLIMDLESDRQIELSLALIRRQMAEAEASITEIRARIETARGRLQGQDAQHHEGDEGH